MHPPWLTRPPARSYSGMKMNPLAVGAGTEEVAKAQAAKRRAAAKASGKGGDSGADDGFGAESPRLEAIYSLYVTLL